MKAMNKYKTINQITKQNEQMPTHTILKMTQGELEI